MSDVDDLIDRHGPSRVRLSSKTPNTRRTRSMASINLRLQSTNLISQEPKDLDSDLVIIEHHHRRTFQVDPNQNQNQNQNQNLNPSSQNSRSIQRIASRFFSHRSSTYSSTSSTQDQPPITPTPLSRSRFRSIQFLRRKPNQIQTYMDHSSPSSLPPHLDQSHSTPQSNQSHSHSQFFNTPNTPSTPIIERPEFQSDWVKSLFNKTSVNSLSSVHNLPHQSQSNHPRIIEDEGEELAPLSSGSEHDPSYRLLRHRPSSQFGSTSSLGPINLTSTSFATTHDQQDPSHPPLHFPKSIPIHHHHHQPHHQAPISTNPLVSNGPFNKLTSHLKLGIWISFIHSAYSFVC